MTVDQRVASTSIAPAWPRSRVVRVDHLPRAAPTSRRPDEPVADDLPPRLRLRTDTLRMDLT
jgi:hypothetical protein